MSTFKAVSVLAGVAFGIVSVAGCAQDPSPEAKEGTASHLETSANEKEGATTDALVDDPESRSSDTPRIASGDDQAAIPVMVVIGIVALGFAAICSTHSYLCTHEAESRCGGKATVKSSCAGSIKSIVEVKCEIECPAGAS